MGQAVGTILGALLFYFSILSPLMSRKSETTAVRKPELIRMVTPEARGLEQVKMSRRKLIIERVPVQYPIFKEKAEWALANEESCKGVNDTDAETFGWGLLGHSLKENALCKGDPEERCDVSSTGARGPEQFMPGTWKKWGRDGDGDGAKNIEALADSAAAAAAYLCHLRQVTGSWSHAMCRYYGDNVDDCDYENRVRDGIETVKTVLAEEEKRKRLEAATAKNKKPSKTLSKAKSTSTVR